MLSLSLSSACLAAFTSSQHPAPDQAPVASAEAQQRCDWAELVLSDDQPPHEMDAAPWAMALLETAPAAKTRASKQQTTGAPGTPQVSAQQMRLGAFWWPVLQWHPALAQRAAIAHCRSCACCNTSTSSAHNIGIIGKTGLPAKCPAHVADDERPMQTRGL